MTDFSIEKYLQELPNIPGIYLMQDKTREVLYIGKAKSLKNRVSSYFQTSATHMPKIQLMLKKVAFIEHIITQSEVEALILEARMIRELQPKYNSRLKDNKSYPYIAITKDPFSKVSIARKVECAPIENFEFYGPYVDMAGLRTSFKMLQKIFKFRSCDLDIEKIRKRKFRPCILAAIQYCSAPCASRISKKKYTHDIQSLQKFLHSDHSLLLKSLESKMLQASAKMEFEEAARLRDQIRGIESLNKRPVTGDFLPGEFLEMSPQQSLFALQKALKLIAIPRVIEGIDIAHHSGHEAVGSLVSFVDGMPYPEGYRRYRIQTHATNDDYLMLMEVLRRRFQGQDQEREYPDVLLVDGGKGQLSSVVTVLAKMEICLPAVIAIAKKNEEIYVPGANTALNIPQNSSIHRLLCYVRDEAHRFAQKYHQHLKRYKIRT